MSYKIPPEIGAFLRWWGNGLLACLPGSLRRLFAEAPVRLILEIRGQDLCFLLEKNGECRELEQYPLQALPGDTLRQQIAALLADARQIILRLPAEQVLLKEVTLPLAAEANLRQVVGFEIDRLTPFSAGQIYYDLAVLERRQDLKRIKIRFVAVLRTLVDPLVTRLAELGVAADRVEVKGEGSGINLLPLEQRPDKSRFTRRLHWALAGLAAGLLVLAGVLPLWQQRSLVVELLPKVAAAQKQAEQILTLRSELENAIEASRFLFQKRKESILNIELLKELTAILPDATWVEQLEISGNEIRVRGQSPTASALLGLVEASKLFQNATFLSPITAGAAGKDRFYLSAQIAREP